MSGAAKKQSEPRGGREHEERARVDPTERDHERHDLPRRGEDGRGENDKGGGGARRGEATEVDERRSAKAHGATSAEGGMAGQVPRRSGAV